MTESGVHGGGKGRRDIVQNGFSVLCSTTKGEIDRNGIMDLLEGQGERRRRREIPIERIISSFNFTLHQRNIHRSFEIKMKISFDRFSFSPSPLDKNNVQRSMDINYIIRSSSSPSTCQFSVLLISSRRETKERRIPDRRSQRFIACRSRKVSEQRTMKINVKIEAQQMYKREREKNSTGLYKRSSIDVKERKKGKTSIRLNKVVVALECDSADVCWAEQEAHRTVCDSGLMDRRWDGRREAFVVPDSRSPRWKDNSDGSSKKEAESNAGCSPADKADENGIEMCCSMREDI